MKEKIEIEVKEITTELCSVFEPYFEGLIKGGNMKSIVGDIVEKTLVCKANRDNPNYPE